MPTVVITGTNRGIGLELARQYAADGWRVIATCRHPDQAPELRSIEGDVEVLRCDITSVDDVERLRSHLSETPIDLLMCNAAILGGPRSRLDNLDFDAWRAGLETNLLGTLRVAIALWPRVAASAERKLVIMSSRAGIARAAKAGASYIYRSSKAALNSAGRMLALDLEDEGVTVLLINPGHVRTGIGGPRAPMSPAESAEAVRSLIAQLGPDASGRFWNFDGSELPL